MRPWCPVANSVMGCQVDAPRSSDVSNTNDRPKVWIGDGGQPPRENRVIEINGIEVVQIGGGQEVKDPRQHVRVWDHDTARLIVHRGVKLPDATDIING